jgi:hypothetical protein
LLVWHRKLIAQKYEGSGKRAMLKRTDGRHPFYWAGSFNPANGENSTESDKARVTNDNLLQINS